MCIVGFVLLEDGVAQLVATAGWSPEMVVKQEWNPTENDLNSNSGLGIIVICADMYVCDKIMLFDFESSFLRDVNQWNTNELWKLIFIRFHQVM